MSSPKGQASGWGEGVASIALDVMALSRARFLWVEKAVGLLRFGLTERWGSTPSETGTERESSSSNQWGDREDPRQE